MKEERKQYVFRVGPKCKGRGCIGAAYNGMVLIKNEFGKYHPLSYDPDQNRPGCDCQIEELRTIRENL